MKFQSIYAYGHSSEHAGHSSYVLITEREEMIEIFNAMKRTHSKNYFTVER